MHRDHTFLPSASGASVRSTLRGHRSPPHVDDVGQRPSVGMGWETDTTDLPFLKIRIFYANGLTTNARGHGGDLPVGHDDAFALLADACQTSETRCRVFTQMGYRLLKCRSSQLLCFCWRRAVLLSQRAFSGSAQQGPTHIAHEGISPPVKQRVATL